jgi:uncharacterized protein
MLSPSWRRSRRTAGCGAVETLGIMDSILSHLRLLGFYIVRLFSGWIDRDASAAIAARPAAVRSTSVAIDPEAHRAAVLAHRARRDARYRSADGWLTLVDRLVLEDGDHDLPVGRLSIAADRAPRLEPAPGVTLGGAAVTGPIDLELDGPPLELAGRRYHLGSRGDLWVVRVRDPEAPARLAFGGIPAYDIDPAYRIETSAFEPLDPPRIDRVGTTDGGEDETPCIGVARFELGGASQALGIYRESGGKLVVPFADPSNGDETYGGGRMLYVEQPAAGQPWVLDFNLAFNPPCAFNYLVACPLPPAPNRLTAAVRAGEKRPAE